MAGPDVQGWSLVVVGAFLLTGYLAHVMGQSVHVPRVSLLLLVGMAAGPSGLDFVPASVQDWFPAMTQVALSLVGFVLGERFFGGRRESSGKAVSLIAAGESLGAALLVFGLVAAASGSLVLALLLGGIAPATDPAATVDVIDETRSRGPLSDTLTGIVAFDDVYGVILFSLCLVAAQVVAGEGFSGQTLLHAGWELGGALLLGAGLGVPMAWLTGRVHPGELTLLEAMGFVLLCSGTAHLLGVSYLLGCMVLGATVARLAQHHTRPLHAIEGVREPFLVVFFVLAGIRFDLGSFAASGVAGVAYLLARSVGLIGGGYVGARIAGVSGLVRRHVGWCLLPQAGVALGLGLVAVQRVPDVGGDLLSIVVGTTLAFEVFGPIVTRLALGHAGEVGAGDADTPSSADAGQDGAP